MKIHNIIILLFTVLTFTFSSCKTKEYIEVPVETIKTEYIHQIDSIYLHDSIFTQITQRGDTVFIDRFKYKVKEVYKIDTVHKTDTIPKIVKVTETIEVNKLHSWQKSLMWIGGVGIFGLLAFLIRKFSIWKLLF